MGGDRSDRSAPVAGSCRGSYPWAAPLHLAALALAIPFMPHVVTSLEWERDAIGRGELWRLFTGHFTHWSLDHLVWDVLAFVVLGVWAFSQSVARFWSTLIGSTLAIGVAMLVWAPDLTTYRGLSGVDSALFALVVVTVWRTGSRGWRWAAVVAFFAFAGKTAFELMTGATLFVRSMGSGVSAVPLAHLVGAVLGVIVGSCAVWPRMNIRNGHPISSSPSSTAR